MNFLNVPTLIIIVKKTKSEILQYIHPIYVERLEKENKLLKEECEKLKKKYEDDLR